MKETLKKCEERMNKRVDHLEVEYREIRAGRANPNILDRITVDYYGAPTAINALAAVSVTEARTLTIQPWDTSVLRGIERAIQASDIGINPQNDGKIIRLVFPPLTEDKRKDIVKDVAKMAEAKKVHIRNIRRDTIEDFKKMKKEGEITEDDLKKSEKKVQELTDKYIKSIDQLCEAKQKEVMSI
ncbi:MAG: ribosome recycling factor [Acutalibacteraceae bacterium]|nr:ribosome recycling factor [Clostridia bacterium]MEE3449798.1 ribosome recycling factor [Acutalibacteraceae bacterium]